MVLGFCSLLAFRQCCCLKVDTRHNIVKQSQQARSSKWFEPFPDVSPENAAIFPIRVCKAMRILMPDSGWRDMHLYYFYNGKQCSFPFFKQHHFNIHLVLWASHCQSSKWHAFNKTMLRTAAFLIIWTGSSKQDTTPFTKGTRGNSVLNLGKRLKGNRAHEIWDTMP